MELWKVSSHLWHSAVAWFDITDYNITGLRDPPPPPKAKKKMLCCCFSLFPPPSLSGRAVVSCRMHVWPDISLAVLLSGAGLGFWGTSSRAVFGWVSFSSLVPATALNHSPSGGVSLWFLAGPYMTQWGLQTHPISSPICPLWSTNSLIYACKLYIFSSVKAGTQSLLGICFLHSWCWVFCDWAWLSPVSPGISLFPTEIRSLKVCMNSCFKMLWEKKKTCSGLLFLIYISVNLQPHMSLPLHLCDVPWQLTSQHFLVVCRKLRG